MHVVAKAVAALAVLPLGVALAQERAPVFPVGLDVVNLTVTVRDANGRLVPHLQVDDFTVFEDNRVQDVSLFAPAVEPGQDEALALDLGLLMDTSESMMHEIGLSKEAAVRFLDAIPRARDLLMVFFDQDIRISRYTNELQQGLFERIVESHSSGNTALYDAIAVYLSRVQDGAGRKVLVLLSDGDDTFSSVSLQEVLELARSSPVTIYCIAFSGDRPIGSRRFIAARGFLSSLSEMTGGATFTPTMSRDLPPIYDTILNELESQYVLGYIPANSRHQGKWRKVRVEVKPDKLRVRHRAGYYEPLG